MIIAGGVNIYPAEIEGEILAHPGVGDVAVFGVPDDDMGEQIKAVIEPAAGLRGRRRAGGVGHGAPRGPAGQVQVAQVDRLLRRAPPRAHRQAPQAPAPRPVLGRPRPARSDACGSARGAMEARRARCVAFRRRARRWRSSILGVGAAHGRGARAEPSLLTASRVPRRCGKLLRPCRVKKVDAWDDADRIMARYAPVTLMLLPAVWLAGMVLAFTPMFWALGSDFPREAFTRSGSSLFTLGFAFAKDLPGDHPAASWPPPIGLGAGGAADLVPPVDLRPVLPAGGPGGPARHAGGHAARPGRAARAGRPHRLAGAARRPVDRLGPLVRGARGEPHLQRRPALLPQPAPGAVVAHGGGLRPRHGVAPRSRASTCPARSRPSCASARASSPCVASPTPSTSRTTPIPRPTDPISRDPRGVRRGVRSAGGRRRPAAAPTATRPGATSPAGGSTTTRCSSASARLIVAADRAVVVRPRHRRTAHRSAAVAGRPPLSRGGRRGGGRRSRAPRPPR